MKSVDLSNAVGSPDITNFTCQLFRLLLKSDAMNKAKLAEVYPVEVEMVLVYKTACLYKPLSPSELSSRLRKVDYEAIEAEAIRRVKARG